MSEPILQQWIGGESPAAQSAAKRHEISLYGPKLQRLMSAWPTGHRGHLVDFQADEAVNAANFCAVGRPERTATFILPPDPGGTYTRMAEAARAGVERQLRLVASSGDVADAGADIMLFTNILSCQGGIVEAAAAVGEAARVLRPGGVAIVTTNNPHGGAFSTYSCADLPPPGTSGPYKLQLAGQADAFDDLYIDPRTLKGMFADAGLPQAMTAVVPDADFKDEGGIIHPAICEEPAFHIYVFEKPGF